MKNLFNKNGLIFWDEREIKLRNRFAEYIVDAVSNELKTLNRAFEVIQVESPVIIPFSLLNPNYGKEDVFIFEDADLTASKACVLRPETTAGSYLAAQELLNTHNERKIRLPLCVWQHGRSFRREQDQELKHMRLKEFHQLEFQILYSPTTANDYSKTLIPKVHNFISFWVGECEIQRSDRLPSYSEETMDVIHCETGLELCSISKRTDFPDAKNLEIAIGTDRVVYCTNDR